LRLQIANGNVKDSELVVASTPRIQSALNFFMNVNSNYFCRSQIT